MTAGTLPPDIIAALETLRRSLDPAILGPVAEKCGLSAATALALEWKLRAPELATLRFPGMATDDAAVTAAELRRLNLTARLEKLGGNSEDAEKFVQALIYRELAKIPTDIPLSTWGPLHLMPPPITEPFLIPGIWVNYGITQWVAWGGTGKGVMGAGTGYALATGAPTFAGLPIFDPHPRNVLIVDFEHHFNEWYNRLKACGPPTDRIIYFKTTGKMDVEGPRIAQAVAEYGIDAVIVDSAVYAIPAGTSSNDPTAPTTVCDPLNALGIPVLLFGHPSLATKDKPEDILGSSFWHNEARLVRGIIKENDIPHVLRFDFSKLSTGPTLPRMTFQIDDHDYNLTVTHVENATGTETGTSALILHALTEHQPMTVSELATKTGRAIVTIKETLRTMETAATGHGPQVEKDGKDGHANLYRLTGAPTLELVYDREVDNIANRMARDIGLAN
jgi:hypothetical protein